MAYGRAVLRLSLGPRPRQVHAVGSRASHPDCHLYHPMTLPKRFIPFSDIGCAQSANIDILKTQVVVTTTQATHHQEYDVELGLEMDNCSTMTGDYKDRLPNGDLVRVSSVAPLLRFLTILNPAVPYIRV